MNLFRSVKEKIITTIKSGEQTGSDPSSSEGPKPTSDEPTSSSSSSSSASATASAAVSSIKAKFNRGFTGLSLNNISVFNDSQREAPTIKNQRELIKSDKSPVSIGGSSPAFTNFSGPPPVSLSEMKEAYIDLKNTLEKLSLSSQVSTLDPQCEELMRTRLRTILMALKYESDRWLHLHSTSLDLSVLSQSHLSRGPDRPLASAEEEEAHELQQELKQLGLTAEEEVTPFVDLFLTQGMLHYITSKALHDAPRKSSLLALLTLRDMLIKIAYPPIASQFMLKNSSKFLSNYLSILGSRYDDGFTDAHSYLVYRKKLANAFIGVLHILWRRVTDSPLLMEYFVLSPTAEKEKEESEEVSIEGSNYDSTAASTSSSASSHGSSASVTPSASVSVAASPLAVGGAVEALPRPPGSVRPINLMEALLRVSLDEFPRLSTRIFSTVQCALAHPNPFIDDYLAYSSPFFDRLLSVYSKYFVSTVDTIQRHLASTPQALYPAYLSLLANFSSTSRFSSMSSSSSSHPFNANNLSSSTQPNIHDLLSDFVTATKFLALIYSSVVRRLIRLYEDNTRTDAKRNSELQKSPAYALVLSLNNLFSQFVHNTVLPSMESSSDAYLVSLYHILYLLFTHLEQSKMEKLNLLPLICKESSLFPLAPTLSDLLYQGILYGVPLKQETTKDNPFSLSFTTLVDKVSSLNKPLACVSSFLLAYLLQSVSTKSFSSCLTSQTSQPLVSSRLSVLFSPSSVDCGISSFPSSIFSASDATQSLPYLLEKMRASYELNYPSEQAVVSQESISHYFHLLLSASHYSSPVSLDSTLGLPHLGNSLVFDRIKKRFSSFLTLRVDEQISFSSLILSTLFSLSFFLYTNRASYMKCPYLLEVLVLYYDLLDRLGSFVKEMKNYTHQVPMFSEKHQIVLQFMREKAEDFLSSPSLSSVSSPTDPSTGTRQDSLSAKKLLEEESIQNKSILTGTIIIESLEQEALSLFHALKHLIGSSTSQPQPSPSLSSSLGKRDDFVLCNELNDEDLISFREEIESGKKFHTEFSTQLDHLNSVREDFDSSLAQFQEALDALSV